jgi:hypothetical protein
MSIWFNLSPGSSKKTCGTRTPCLEGEQFAILRLVKRHLLWVTRIMKDPVSALSKVCVILCESLRLERGAVWILVCNDIVGCRGFPISSSKLHWTEWMPGFPSLSCTKMHQIPSSNVDRAGVRMGEIVCVYMCMNPQAHIIWIIMDSYGTKWHHASQRISTHRVCNSLGSQNPEELATSGGRCMASVLGGQPMFRRIWSKHKQTTGTYRNHTSFSCVIYSDLRYIEVHSLWLEFVPQAWCRLYSALNVASSPLAPQNIQLSHRSGCSGCLRETATIQWLLSFVGMWHVVQCGTMRLNVLNLLIHVLISWATA